MKSESTLNPLNTPKRIALVTILAWLSIIGIDFFIHGGLLATFYVQPSQFLLPLTDAFKLIPLGYLAFLLQAGLLVWLMNGLGIYEWRGGIMFGATLGALTSGAMVLGLASISTASTGLLVGWFLGQSVEFAIAGLFTAMGLAGKRLGRLYLVVFAGIVVSFIATVMLQSIGFAPIQAN